MYVAWLGINDAGGRGGGAGAGALNMESVVYERAELRMFVPSYEPSTQAHVAVAIVQTRRSQFGRSSGPILRDSNLSRLLWTVSLYSVCWSIPWEAVDAGIYGRPRPHPCPWLRGEHESNITFP